MQEFQRLFKYVKVKLFSPAFKKEPLLIRHIENISNLEEYLQKKIDINPHIKIGVFLDGNDLI